MINNISWGSYWFALTVMVVVYYAFVILVYYRGDLLNLLSNKGNAPSPRSFQETLLTKENKDQPESKGEQLPGVIQSLMDEIYAYFNQVFYAKAGKQEIIFAMQQITKKYDTVKNSEYEPWVNKLVRIECEDKCAVYLSDEELRQVWLS